MPRLQLGSRILSSVAKSAVGGLTTSVLTTIVNKPVTKSTLKEFVSGRFKSSEQYEDLYIHAVKTYRRRTVSPSIETRGLD